MKNPPYTLPVDAQDILRKYAEGTHHTNNLMIGIANWVENVLKLFGADFPGSGYSVGMSTRLYSYNEVSHFPDSNLRYLRDPTAFRKHVIDAGGVPGVVRLLYAEELNPLCPTGIGNIDDKLIRSIHRERIATLLWKKPKEVRSWYTRRLLDKPEICDFLIESFNEYQIEKFRKRISWNKFYKLEKHRLRETKNKARHEKPATIGTYIARAFCPEGMPAVAPIPGNNEGKRKETQCFAARDKLRAHLPIDPDAISDESLTKVGLAPADFEHYTLQARRRYKMAVVHDFLALLLKAQPTARLHAGEDKETARVITFLGADGLEKIGIFSTITDISTRIRSSIQWERNQHNRLADTELRIFAGKEEAIRSQEHAIEHMQERVSHCAELFNQLSEYKQKTSDEKPAYLQGVVESARVTFGKKTGFYDQLILRYLNGSSEWKPTKSILENPPLIGILKKTLVRSMQDLRGKIKELWLLLREIGG